MGADHSTPPPTKQRRVAILGPSGAGKTTLLLQWTHHAIIPTLPTVGFNVETVVFEDTLFTMWDIPGQVALQPCWPQYCSSVDAVVFVVDATGRSSLGAARDALHAAFAVARPSRCLIVANKTDQPECVDALELLEILRPGDVFGTSWSYCAVSATQGDGLRQCLAWLAHEPLDDGALLQMQDYDDDANEEEAREDWIWIGSATHLPGSLEVYYTDIPL